MSDSSGLARLACSACRRQKRRCSRELPACQLCRKNRRRCGYAPEALDGISASDDSPTTDATASSSTMTIFPGALLRSRQTATSLFFLDSYVFQISHSAVVQPTVELPPEYLRLLDVAPSQILADVGVYFARFHPVFPIISKMRLYRNELAAPRNCSADTLFLLLVMRLICHSLDPGADQDALALCYAQSKGCAAFLEASGLVSLPRLQACLLLAHHELSQALYPAAYMSVGACARLGQMMGIHSSRAAPRTLKPSLSVLEDEEIHRAWWATLILDRYCNIGIDERPFSCRDAKPSDQLPMDEASWETGETAARPSLAVSAAAFVEAPPFARACQAAHLLSRVLHHSNDTGPATPDDYAAFYQEGLQLHRVVSAFAAALWQELQQAEPPAAVALFPSIGLCFSAQMTLYDVHLCADADHPAAVGMREQLEMQTLALASAKAVVSMITEFAPMIHQASDARNGEDADGTGSLIVSPLVATCVYQAARLTAWYYRDSGQEKLLEGLGTLKTALGHIGQTFQIANEYLAILDMNIFPPPT